MWMLSANATHLFPVERFAKFRFGLFGEEQAMRSAAFLLSGFASFSAFADCNTDYCYNVTVSELYVNTNGIVYIGTSGDESILACGAVANVFVTLNMSEPSADAVYAALLAAQARGQPVLIQVDDNISGCPIQYVTVGE